MFDKDTTRSVVDTQREMPRYKCPKQVWALRIKAIAFDREAALHESRETDGSAVITPVEEGYAPFRVDAAFLRKHEPKVGDYYVVYPDGYKSCFPAQAFEDGYTRVA